MSDIKREMLTVNHDRLMRKLAVRAEPFDLAAWNQARLDACRITGTTFEFQNDMISEAAIDYANREA